MEETKLLFTISLLLLVSIVANSELGAFVEGERFATGMLHKAQVIDAKDLELITGQLHTVNNGCDHCKSNVQNRRQLEIHNGILVFVSFSMPNTVLRELNDAAAKYGAILVIRGLYKNSFTATKNKILEVNKHSLRLSIDPQLFKRYNIKNVPTFIRIEKGREIARLIGNVPMEFAVQKLNEVAI